jgi:hypothetical protein
MQIFATLAAAREAAKSDVRSIIEIDHETEGRCYILCRAAMVVLAKAIAAKPLQGVVRLVAEHPVKSDEQVASEQAAFDAAVPGLDELRAARSAKNDYDRSMSKFIAGDGLSRRPVRPETDVEALATAYPRANVYLLAEAYSNASNDRKSSAGVRAMSILKAGGSIDEARRVLDGWLDGVNVD